MGIVCHCFSPTLEVPTFATTCLCVLSDARDPSSEMWNCGRERCPVVILPKFRDILHAANLRHGTDGFNSPPKEGVLTASAGFDPANMATKGQHATSRPPKPIITYGEENDIVKLTDTQQKTSEAPALSIRNMSSHIS